MSKPVTITKDNTKKLAATLKAFAQQQVLVGVPSDTAGRRTVDDEPINNATIAYIQENGSPAANIPPRPFLRPGIANAKDKIVGRYKGAAKKALSGDASALSTAHEAVGLIAANSVKRKITDGPFAPLSEATLATRKRRGRKGDKPLIDTGQLRNSITFVVRPSRKK